MKFQNTLAFARSADKADSLRKFRKEFLFPQHQKSDALYFCGNSLGLQPRNTQKYLEQELKDWQAHGVEGHFRARDPWYNYHEQFAVPLSKLVGAKPSEVVAMNSLTVNLHLLMASFYKPTKTRYKILCEAKAFPSDQYAFASQAAFHGHDPAKAVIEVKPTKSDVVINTKSILNAISRERDSLALVLFSGVNYYTGQAFDMKQITKYAHSHGVTVGFDLAHAMGNIPMQLHNWGVDFAVWCGYKYLNSGPGSVGGAFVHSIHGNNAGMHRLAGWWGHDTKVRFRMEKEFVATPGAQGWQMSNAPVLSMAAHKAALELFDAAGIKNLRKKSLELTGYLRFLIEEINKKFKDPIHILTPKSDAAHGAQLSLLMHSRGREIFDKLTEQGVVVDWREPDVIRMAPVPLYNSFEDVYRFGQLLEKCFKN